MLKITGSVLILAGGVLLWKAQLTERRRRRDTLAEVLTALRHMEAEIHMARTPLPELLADLAGGCVSDAGAFFAGAAACARQGGDLRGLWRSLVRQLPLQPEEQATLSTLGDSLHGNEESICKAISLAIYELANRQENMEKNRQAEEKRTTALCFSAAALLVILLI